MKKLLLSSVVLIGLASSASAQTYCRDGSNNPVPVTSANCTSIAVTASLSATVNGFVSTNTFATLTATGSSSASTALPTAGGGTVTNITNTGTTAVSCTFATGAATGLRNNMVIQPGSSRMRGNGTFDHVACIDQGGADSTSNVVTLEGGTGLGVDSGGGSSGGTAANASVSATGAAVPASATYVGITSGGNLTGWNGQVTQPTAANFNATVVQGTAANLNATVVGNGTFAVQAAQSGSWTSTVTQPTAANLNATVSQATGTNLHVVCDSGCSGSGGTSSNFAAAFPTAGTAIGVKNGANMVNLAADASSNLLVGGASGAFVSGAFANGAIVAEGSTTDTPCTLPASGTACSLVAVMKANANATNSAIPAGTAHIGTVGTAPYPDTAVPYTATATGTTAATTATLAGAASVTTYICGFSIRANATAAATGNATVTGTITGTLNFTQWTAPNASGLGITEEVFIPCVPASTTNTSIAVVSAAPGTGGVVSVTAWGYKL